MHGRKRVLVLDFDADLLITLQAVLENAGFDTMAAWKEADAIDLLATRYFDFLVVANRPPRLNARCIVQDMRERGIECGSYVIGAGRAQKDDFSRLLDCIRDYPCSARSREESLLEAKYGSEALVGAGYCN